MDEILIARWTELLRKAEAEGILSLGTVEQPPTFIEITRHQRKENFCSNILAFFFKTGAQHHLGDLLVSSLLEVYKEKSPDDNFATEGIEVVNVSREYSTDERKRIDLLIKTRRHVIGIENKIYADAYNNDFKNYEKTIREVASNYLDDSSKLKPVYVILSLNKQEQHENFIPITYDEFFKKIEKNLGKYVMDANPKYLPFLLDFIKTIQNLTMNNELNQEIQEFLQKEKDNVEKIEQLTDAIQKYKEHLRERLIGDKKLLEHFNKKSDIIGADWKNGTGGKKKYIYIGFKERIDQDHTHFGIDLFHCLPASVTIDVFLHKKDWSLEHSEWTKKLLRDSSLEKEFKVSEKDENKFRIKESIPMDKITNEDNVLDRLIKAILKEYETKAKQAGE